MKIFCMAAMFFIFRNITIITVAYFLRSVTGCFLDCVLSGFSFTYLWFVHLPHCYY
jgi:hypothetical protein